MSDGEKKQFENDYSAVGNGYRNVYYSQVKDEDTGEKRGEITLLGYDIDGNPKEFKFPYRVSAAYHIVGDETDTGEVDLYGDPLRRKFFDTSYERSQWVKSMDESSTVRVVEALPPEDAFIMDAFGHRIYDDDYNQLPLRIHFFDIEVAVENLFPYPEQAEFPINIITILDSIDRQYYSWAMSDTPCQNTLGEYDGCKVNLFKFGNEKLRVDLEYRFAKGEIDAETLDAELKKARLSEEKRMLKHFINWTKAHRPDVYSGWNSRAFDMPYIVRRVENVLGKQWAAALSPGGKYRAKKLVFENDDSSGEKKKPDRNNTVYLLPGVSQMDLQVLYRDKFKIRSALDGGYGLNNVSLVELDDEKIKHEESFSNFWKVNFQKYWEYNVQDVSLVYRIEEKLGIIKQARTITAIGSTNMDSIYQSINYIMQSLAMFSKSKHGRTWQTHKAGSKAKGEKYTGAFVFAVQTGVYRFGEATVDYNSLYPNTGRSLNLSPETKMGVVFGDWDDPDEQLYILPNERVWKVSAEAKRKILVAQASGLPGVKLSRKALIGLLEDTCCCSVAIERKDGQMMHVLFKKYEVQPGIFSEWLGFYFERRKALKKICGQYEDKADAIERELEAKGVTDIHEIKHNPEFAEADNMYHRYDNLQQATKILINSAYGTLGTPSSPIYDVDLAETITLNGQFANKSAARKIKEIYQERYGTSEDFVPQLSGDTDSVTGDMTVDAVFSDSLLKKLVEAEGCSVDSQERKVDYV